MAKIKLVVSATIEETFSDFIISRKTKPSTKNREREHGKPGWEERGKARKRERKGRTGEATVRRKREERGKEETEAE